MNMARILMCLVAAVVCVSCATSKKHSAGAPKMLLRTEWGAQAPVLPMKAHTPNRITVHHTATLQKFDQSVKEKILALQKFSQNPGKLGNGKAKPAWADVPYHYYIDCKGEIAEGRDVNFAGDTNTEYDPTEHALVVLEGNFEEEQPTDAQMVSLKAMVAWLRTRFDVPPERIKTHKDYAKTACPGKNLYERMMEVRIRDCW